MRVHDSLATAAHTNPALPFAVSGSHLMTYRRAAETVDRIGIALSRSGLRCGDRAAVIAKNSIEFALLYFGCFKPGVVLVPINYRLASPEVAFILNDSQSAAIFAGNEFVTAIEQCRSDLPMLRTFVALESDPALAGWMSFDQWLADINPLVYEATSKIAPNPPAVQMYTSGTTGRRKGAILGQQSLIGTARSCQAWFAGSPGDRNLLVLPMFHIFGAAIAFTVPRVLGTLLIMRDFNAGAVIHSLREQSITFASFVPTMIQACLDHPDAALEPYVNLKAIVYGASSMPETTLRHAIDVFGCDFLQAYGMTEIAPITTLFPSSHRRALNGEPHLLHSVGQALPGIEVRVVNRQDEDVSPGTDGEILARGDSLMLGYWKLPDASASALRGGWMHTGDVGHIDIEGNLYIVDRLKDMIISGAENVYPREVEEVLCTMPGVSECAVIGVPDPIWGETIKAFIVRSQDADLTEKDVINFCRGELANFKVPRHVEFMDKLPRTASGKVLKRQLRQMHSVTC